MSIKNWVFGVVACPALAMGYLFGASLSDTNSFFSGLIGAGAVGVYLKPFEELPDKELKGFSRNSLVKGGLFFVLLILVNSNLTSNNVKERLEVYIQLTLIAATKPLLTYSQKEIVSLLGEAGKKKSRTSEEAIAEVEVTKTAEPINIGEASEEEVFSYLNQKEVDHPLNHSLGDLL